MAPMTVRSAVQPVRPGRRHLAFAKKRLPLSQGAVGAPADAQNPKPARTRCAPAARWDSSFRQLARATQAVSKWGSLYAERVVPGITPKTPFRPVEPAQQREALPVHHRQPVLARGFPLQA